MLNTTTHRGVSCAKAEHQVGRRFFRRFYHHCSAKSFNRLLRTRTVTCSREETILLIHSSHLCLPTFL